MPSPFPGMDPFIESRRIWSDFHLDLAAEIRAHLNARIQPGYYATAVTYVTYDVIEVAHAEPRAVAPDVSVWRTDQPMPTQSAMAVIDPPPVQSMVPLEVPLRLAKVEVREAGADTLVTAIEILSPINKRPGRERQKYLRKRRELLRSEVHVMELDLLRVDVWPIPIESRLPVLPVPLTAPDPDVPLDLGAIVQAVYERGGYATRIDYHQPVPPPPLEAEQQAWIKHLLAAHWQ
jgi:hypothetical protein